MTDIVDLFAGAGGFSTGARLAGANVVWAANHWPQAVEAHARNHPETIHVCQDLQQADWRELPPHDVMCASPACQGHANARGRDRPHHDVTRATAWAVVACAEYHRQDAILVENVPEFLAWKLYPAWKLAMESLGYAVAPHVIDAADCGVPQNRERAIIACTRSRAPIRLKIAKQAHVAAATILDFASGRWSPVVHPARSQATIDRARAGHARYGNRFVMPYYGSGSGKTGRSIDRPLGTVTTRDRWAVVDGDEMRMLTVAEYKRAMSFPEDYALPGTSKKLDLHLLGNAVPPLMAKAAIEALLAAT